MSIVARDTIKQWFETGDFPTQQQFWDWLDSYVHKDELATGPTPDDLTLVVGVDIPAGVLEFELLILLNRRFRVFRNNTKIFDWTYKLNGSLQRTGVVLTGDETETIATEKFLIEFY